MGEMLLLKLGPFYRQELGDPKQPYQDFTKYISGFKEFFNAAWTEGNHTNTERSVDCGGCKNAKSTMKLVGGTEMNSERIRVNSSTRRASERFESKGHVT